VGSSPDGAKEYVKRAAELCGDDPNTLTGCASLMFYLRDFDQSQRYVQRASETASKGFELVVDLIHVTGRLASQKGDDELAEQALSMAFQEEPEGIDTGAPSLTSTRAVAGMPRLSMSSRKHFVTFLRMRRCTS
jgi:hypothetical protein